MMKAGQNEKHHCSCLSDGDNEERRRLMSRRYTRSAVWWRGWGFEVAFGGCSRSYGGGQPLRMLPTRRNLSPRGPSCSNPTLSWVF
jgi:hypothetical protein